MQCDCASILCCSHDFSGRRNALRLRGLGDGAALGLTCLRRLKGHCPLRIPSSLARGRGGVRVCWVVRSMSAPQEHGLRRLKGHRPLRIPSSLARGRGGVRVCWVVRSMSAPQEHGLRRLKGHRPLRIPSSLARGRGGVRYSVRDSYCSTRRSNSHSAESTASGRDMSTPASFSRSMGCMLPPRERNLR